MIFFFLSLSGWYCIDIVRKNSVLVTHGSLRVKQSWSPLSESQQPVCIVFHLYLSRTVWMKLRKIFQIQYYPYLSPLINVSSIFEQVLYYKCSIIAYIGVFFFFLSFSMLPWFLEPVLSTQLVLSGHLVIPHGWSPNTGLTVH